MYNNWPERIISALSYITAGFVGFFWLIFCLLTKRELHPFVQYHTFQSIFLSIAYFLISMLLGFIVNLLSFIPFINVITAQIVFYLNAPFFFGIYSLIQVFVYSVVIYLSITSLMGQYSKIPYISDIIDANTHRN